ncbi:hypothetical protein I317_06100 [Kwoniella heveanensis CBS 569]|nr:hypothetical protein I317_06100 [Kwoniella heveanensis CBS 569]
MTCSADPTQRAWVEQQLRISPIAPGQSPEDWLLFRSMIAEGQTEAEAWLNAQLFRQTGGLGAALAQPDFSVPQHHPTPPPAHLSPPTQLYALDNAVFQQPNGYYQGHQDRYSRQQQQQHQPQASASTAPYGFVNLQQIEPHHQTQEFYQSSSQNQQQPSLDLNGQPVIHEQKLAFGPSTVRTPSHLSSPSLPATINPAQLNATLVNHHAPEVKRESPDVKPETRSDTPFRLEPPNSSRTPSPKATTPLSVHSAVGLKRTLSPLYPEAKAGISQPQQRKPKKNSSAFDPPSPPGGDAPAASDKNSGRLGAGSLSSNETSLVTMETIRPLLAPGALKEPKPIPLFKNLRERSVKGKEMPPLFKPNPRELREIAIQLRDYASSEYLRAMADDHRYCEVWESWLNKAKSDVEKWEPAIAPMLQVLARTDMPVDYIKEIKFRAKAKTIANLAQERNLAHKGAIQTAWLRYRAYVEDVLFPANRFSAEYLEEQAEAASACLSTNKRKLDAVTQDDGKPGPSKLPTPAANGATSKLGLSAGASSGPSKPSSNPKSATDMSFFGTGAGADPSPGSSGINKPKVKLPDIKKVDSTSAASRQPPPAATTSTSGLLASTLSSLTKNVGGSTPTNLNARSGGATPEYEKKDVKPARYTAKGRLIRSVRFKDLVREEEGGGVLQQVREFKEEAWEFETPTWEENLSTVLQLDKAEGAALAKKWGHELIDWYEPIPYWEVPADYPPVTPEAAAQTEREHGILAIAYPPGIPVPDPTESDVRVIESDESQMRMMEPVNDSELVLQHQARGVKTHTLQPTAAASVAIPQASVSDLLKNLSGLQSVIPPAQSSNAYQPHPPASISIEYSHSYGYGHNQGHNGYGTHQQQPQRRWGGQDSYGDRTPAWGGNDNYARTGYDQRESRRPQDRDLGRPPCRFWPRE